MCKSGKYLTILMSAIFATVLSVVLYFNVITMNQVGIELYGVSKYIQSISIPKSENVDFNRLVRANIQIFSGKYTGSGTVVAIEDDYIYILTARHVVESDRKKDRLVIEIPITDKNFIYKDKTYGADIGCILVDANRAEDVIICVDYDIALIRIKDFPGHELSWLPPGRKEPVLGDILYVVGNPQSFRDIISKGIFVGEEIFSGLTGYQIYAGVSYGNSGGAIVNTDGEIIGVMHSKMSGGVASFLAISVPRQPMLKFVVGAYEIFEKEDAAVTK